MSFGPACPACGKAVPFLRTQWALGRPFACARCGASIVMPKSYLALLTILAYALLRDRIDPDYKLAILALLLLGVLLIDLLRARPRLAPADPPAA